MSHAFSSDSSEGKGRADVTTADGGGGDGGDSVSPAELQHSPGTIGGVAVPPEPSFPGEASLGFVPNQAPERQQSALSQPGAFSVEGPGLPPQQPLPLTSLVRSSAEGRAEPAPELNMDDEPILIPTASVVHEHDGGVVDSIRTNFDERDTAFAVAEKHPDYACYMGGHRIFCSRRMLAAIVAVTIGVAIGIGVSTGLIRQSRHPPLIDSERLQAVRGAILSITPDAAVPTLDDPASPRRQALEWISNDDGMQLSPDETENIIQRYILALLYFSTDGSGWIDNVYFLTDSHECTWTDAKESGPPHLFKTISCNEDNLVTGVSLPVNNLKGTIPDEMMSLSHLSSLNLGGNSITGKVPEWLGSMPTLLSLHLSTNKLTGSIPATLGSAQVLTFLSIYSNDLTATIPEEIGKIGTLTTLSLSGNRLTGTLPTSLQNLSKLSQLYLYNNDLEGSANFLCDLGIPFEVFEVDCEIECNCCTMCHEF